MIISLALAATALAAAPSFAAMEPNFGKPPGWVEVAQIPDAPPADGAAAVQTLLDDNQARLGPDGDAYYNRRVRKVLKPEGLAGMTSLSLSWSPDTETLTFHALKILRDGKTIDLLGGGDKMLVIRRETGLEAAMLDGRMTASQQIEGLQVGDILDAAFTMVRKDPVFQGHSYDAEGLNFAGPVGRYRARISWPDAKPVAWKATPGYGDLTVTQGDGRKWAEIDLSGVSAPKPPIGAPLRFRRLGTLEVSDFGTWREVSRLMWPHYAKSMVLSANSPVKAEAAAIAARTKDPRARAFAALQLVEDKTRYFFIGIGDGGYVPAKADETWARKFGDCKGKTVLLLALLKELGIEAQPALVNLGGGDGMDERVPSLGAFNHVIVRAAIDGKVYWMDGTRTGDRGGLDALKAPNHRWALPLAAEGAELAAINQPPLAEPSATSTMRIDATQGLDAPAPILMSTRFTGDAANGLRQSVARSAKADLERSFRQQLSGSMSWVEVESIEWKDDADNDAFSIEVHGKADLDWRKNADLGMREYKISAAQTQNQTNGYPRREAGPNRDAPFAIPYPLFVRSRTEIALPQAGRGFTVRGPNTSETVGGYEIKRSSGLENGVAVFLTESRTLSREISAADAEAATRKLRQLAGEDSLVRAPL